MFRIGEFAQVAQVSGRLLRYYDQIGLLSPIHTDPQTGYRYYSASQLPRLNSILALKSLGLSLDQIAASLDGNVSSDELRGMLQLRKAQAEQSLREEQSRLREIESRIRQIDSHGAMRDFDVVVKSCEAAPILSLRQTCADMDEAGQLLGAVVDSVRGDMKPGAWSNLIVVAHSEFEERDLDLEVGVILAGRRNAPLPVPGYRDMTVGELPAAREAATLVRSGPAYESHFAFGALGMWMESNGFVVDGPCREIFLELPFRDPAKEESVVEIQFPIKPSG